MGTPQYDAKHTTGVYLKLNKDSDKDILARLAREAAHKETGGKQGYIKRLIRADIEKEG